MKKFLSFLLSAVIIAASMFTLSVSASAATKWNGTSDLKSGENYAVSSDVVMDSKFTIPKKTTLTVAEGGSLTVSKGVTATVDGTLNVATGGVLKIDGSLVCSESSVLKIEGKFSYSASAKVKINGKYEVTSTGTASGNGTEEINLSAKSQYNSDMSKINKYLDKKNYSKACALLENAISAYPEKKSSLQKAYSSAVIDWADSLADKKEYLKACGILETAKQYLSNTKDVENRYNFYQGYIPVRLASLKPWEGNKWYDGNYTDTLGNNFYDASVVSNGSKQIFKIDGKFTNFKMTLACWDTDTERKTQRIEDNFLRVYVDNVLVYISKPMSKGTKPVEVNLDISGAANVKIEHSGPIGRGIICDSAVFYKE